MGDTSFEEWFVFGLKICFSFRYHFFIGAKSLSWSILLRSCKQPVVAGSQIWRIVHPVCWGCRIWRLHFCRGVIYPTTDGGHLLASTHKVLRRDPGGWAVLDPATEWSMACNIPLSLALTWFDGRSDWARSDQSAGLMS